MFDALTWQANRLCQTTTLGSSPRCRISRNASAAIAA